MKLISEELVGGLVEYLLTRPMKEVELGVQGLRNLQTYVEPTTQVVPVPSFEPTPEPIMQG